jgi:hypothetical protein
VGVLKAGTYHTGAALEAPLGVAQVRPAQVGPSEVGVVEVGAAVGGLLGLALCFARLPVGGV